MGCTLKGLLMSLLVAAGRSKGFGVGPLGWTPGFGFGVQGLGMFGFRFQGFRV